MQAPRGDWVDDQRIVQVTQDVFTEYLHRLGIPLNQRLLSAVTVACGRVRRSVQVAFEADVLPEVQRINLGHSAVGNKDFIPDAAKFNAQHSAPLVNLPAMHSGPLSLGNDFLYADANEDISLLLGLQPMNNSNSGSHFSMGVNHHHPMHMLDMPRFMSENTPGLGSQDAMQQQRNFMSPNLLDPSDLNASRVGPQRATTAADLSEMLQNNMNLGQLPGQNRQLYARQPRKSCSYEQFYSGPVNSGTPGLNMFTPGSTSGDLRGVPAKGYTPPYHQDGATGPSAPHPLNLSPVVRQRIMAVTQIAPSFKLIDFDEKTAMKNAAGYLDTAITSHLDTAMKNGAGYLDTAITTHLDVLMAQRSHPGATTLQEYAKCVLTGHMFEQLSAAIESNHWLSWSVWDQGVVNLLSKLPEERARNKLMEIGTRSFRNVNNITGCITTILSSMNRNQNQNNKISSNMQDMPQKAGATSGRVKPECNATSGPVNPERNATSGPVNPELSATSSLLAGGSVRPRHVGHSMDQSQTFDTCDSSFCDRHLVSHPRVPNCESTMFGLMSNFYHWAKAKREKRVTLILIGLDNAGKSTLLNTIQGELDKETAPTMGFNPGGELATGGKFAKYRVQVFDLGGGSRIRKIWKTYFAEVHGVIFVLDAADKARFEEAHTELMKAADESYLQQKPLLIFANKQDLPDASSTADIEGALGLPKFQSSAVQMLPCIAKCGSDRKPDPRLKEGVHWLMAKIDGSYGPLRQKVQADMEEDTGQECETMIGGSDVQKKLERDKRVQALREERARQAQLAEEEEARAASQATQDNALAELPNLIVSPGRVPQAEGLAGEGSMAGAFSDLNTRTPEQRSRLGASTSGAHSTPTTEMAIPSSSRPATLSPSRPSSALYTSRPIPRPSNSSRPTSASGPRPPPIVVGQGGAGPPPAVQEEGGADVRELPPELPEALPSQLPPSEPPLSMLSAAMDNGTVEPSSVGDGFGGGARSLVLLVMVSEMVPET
eukprot:gene18885-25443_t